MPIFEYLCEGCGRKFEKIVLGRGTGDLACPRCGAASVERIHSRFAAVGSSKSGGGDFAAEEGLPGGGPEGVEGSDDLDGGPGGYGDDSEGEGAWGEDDEEGPEGPEGDDEEFD